ncbi:hypothetical protein [Phenylobacterium zucineum]|uniref:hypothetical protein n=1 Tax=Phenylobacterium zucineum TaxID=284016 RepID=UPI00031DA763|nr:hypothetical protein [Phenylobacterium zucineum]
MSRRLEDELIQLGAEPPPAGLDELESRVWRRIAEVRAARAAAPVTNSVRVAAVIAALGLGAASGSLTAAAAAVEPSEISAFSLRADLAPSTLLDGPG